MAGTPSETFALVFSSHHHQRYKKNDVIIRDGDQIQKMYWLKSGYVRLYAISASGKEISLNIFTPGMIFPFAVSHPDKMNHYYFETMTTVEVYSMPVGEFRTRMAQSKLLTTEYNAFLTSSLDDGFRHMEALAIENAYAKVVSILSYFCRVYCDGMTEMKQTCTIPLSHQAIATWINASRETVSRQMEKLRKKGILKNRNRAITICDTVKLEAELEGDS